MHRVLKIVEKRLDVNLWRIGGKNHKCSYFPVVFSTKNPCRRSPDACERRRRKQLEGKSEWGTWHHKVISDAPEVDSGSVAAAVVGAKRKRSDVRNIVPWECVYRLYHEYT